MADQLLAMGFPEDQCHRALQASNNNVDAALEFLLSQSQATSGPSPPARPPPPGPPRSLAPPTPAARQRISRVQFAKAANGIGLDLDESMWVREVVPNSAAALTGRVERFARIDTCNGHQVNGLQHFKFLLAALPVGGMITLDLSNPRITHFVNGQLGFELTRYMEIMRIYPGSQAIGQDVEAGCRLVDIDGVRAPDNLEQLVTLLRSKQPDAVMRLTWVAPRHASGPPAAAPQAQLPQAACNTTFELSAHDTDLGLHISITPEGLVCVEGVTPPAKMTEVKAGDYLLQLNETPLAGADASMIIAQVQSGPKPQQVRLCYFPTSLRVSSVPPTPMAGTLMKRARGKMLGRQPWQERHMMIRDAGVLVWFKSPKEAELNAGRTTDSSISLPGCSITPASDAGREFAFQIQDLGAPGETTLVLAAGSQNEAAMWMTRLREFAEHYASQTTTMKGQLAAERGRVVELLTVMQSNFHREKARDADHEAAEARAIEESKEVERARMQQAARLSQTEEQQLQAVMEASKRLAEEEDQREKAETLQGLFHSSFDYARAQENYAKKKEGEVPIPGHEEQQQKLAYDAYKLAVTFYMKAKSIIEELEELNAGDSISSMDRADNEFCLTSCMRAADACYLKASNLRTKSHMPAKPKKRKKSILAVQGNASIVGAASGGAALLQGTSATNGTGSATLGGILDEFATQGQPQISVTTTEWTTYYTPEGKPYYHNHVTGESSWELPQAAPATPTPSTPAPPTSDDPFAAVDVTPSSEVLSVSPETSSQEWTMYHTEEGQAYYYNSTTGESQWEAPENFGANSEPTLLDQLGFETPSVTAQQTPQAVSSTNTHHDHDDLLSDFLSPALQQQPLSDDPSTPGVSLDPLPESPSDGAAADESSKRANVLNELLEFERNYVADLNIIKLIGDEIKDYVPEATHNQVFGAINMISAINIQMLEELENTMGSNPDPCIGTTLNQFFPMMKLYRHYSDSFNAVLSTLSELEGEEGTSDYAKQLTASMQAHEKSGLFQGLLIKPMQQICRYPLLLERLISDSAGHPDCPSLQQARATIEEVAHHVDSGLKEQTQMLELLRLQSCMFPRVTLLKAGRQFLMEGDLEKVMAKDGSTQNYHFFLFSDAIAYGTMMMMNYYNLHRIMALEMVHENVQGNNCQFEILGDQKNLSVIASSPEEKMKWVKAIQSHITTNKNRRQSFIEKGTIPSPTGINLHEENRALGWSWQKRRSSTTMTQAPSIYGGGGGGAAAEDDDHIGGDHSGLV